MKRSRVAVVTAAVLIANLLQAAPRKLPAPYADPWYVSGRKAVAGIDAQKIAAGPARNVIVFIGDGMGMATVTAARILDGQSRGLQGEENVLSFERLPYTALAKTYNLNAQVPDSAGTASAIFTGVKTNAGVVSADGDVKPRDYAKVAGNSPQTLLELAESWGMSTGVITTSTLTDATPATTYAHSAEREWQNDARLPGPARAAGVRDIARQLVEFGGNGLEVALGGGRSHFLPQTLADPETPGEKGRRHDGRDLVTIWLERPRSAYVWNRAQFEAVDPRATDHLLGLFATGMLKSEVDRASDRGGEPSLAEMTAKAIDILSRNEAGFALVVEDEWIDQGHHGANAYRALHATINLARAVEVALKKTRASETLIVVTGDHSHMFVFGGNATRGNLILGKARGNTPEGEPRGELSTDLHGRTYTTLLYGTGPGHKSPRPDLKDADTTSRDYKQESAVPTSSEFHGGEDVPVYAGGPGAHRFRGVIEQNVLFHLIIAALLSPRR
jgi:alkaline phosphatase